MSVLEKMRKVAESFSGSIALSGRPKKLKLTGTYYFDVFYMGSQKKSNFLGGFFCKNNFRRLFQIIWKIKKKITYKIL